MRAEKVAILGEVTERVKDSDYCFIINHGGVTVAQFAALRKALRALDSRLLVVKNTSHKEAFNDQTLAVSSEIPSFPQTC